MFVIRLCSTFGRPCVILPYRDFSYINVTKVWERSVISPYRDFSYINVTKVRERIPHRQGTGDGQLKAHHDLQARPARLGKATRLVVR